MADEEIEGGILHDSQNELITEYGWYHQDFGYWQTLSYPSVETLMSYPEGTIMVPLKPGPYYEWVNGEWVNNPPPPLTPEEIRAAMPVLGRLDFKTRFKNNGMGLAKITAYFASIEGDESHWEDMQNYYAETPTFARLAPFVLELAEFSLKTPEQIDAIWTA